MELFRLFGKIAIENSEAIEAMDETTEQSHSLGESLKAGIATVVKWGAAITTAAVAAGTAVVAFATKAASAGDNIDKMSQKIGISRQAYQELDFICSQSGTSVDTLQMGIKTLTNQMQSAADGTQSAVDMFKKLGVSIYDSNGQLKDQETMMWEAMSALQGMENQTEKAALATDLFGRSGSELMPLLNGAEGSIESMKEKAHELGLVMSDEFVDDSVAFTDTMDQFKRSISSAGMKIASSLLPHIQTLVDKFVGVMPKINEFASGISSGINTFISAMSDGEKRAELFSSVLHSVFTDDFSAKIIDFTSKLWGMAERMKDSAFTSFSENFAKIKTAVEALWPTLQHLGENGLTYFMERIETVMSVIETIVIPIFNLVSTVWTDLATTVYTAVAPAITRISDTFTSMKTAIHDAIQTYILPVCQSFIEMVQNVYNENQDKIAKIGEIFSIVFNAIATVFEWFNTNIVQGVFIPAIQAVVGFVEENMGLLEEIFQTAFDIIGGIIDFFIALFTGNWQGMWEAIKGIVNSAFEFIKKVFTLLKNALVSIMQAIWSKLVEIWENIKTAISQKVSAILSNVRQKFEEIKTAISTKITEAKNKVAEIFELIKTTISEKITAAKTKVEEIFEAIRSYINDKLTQVKIIVTTIFTAVSNLISTKSEEAKEKATTAFENLKTAISEKITAAKTKVEEVFDGIKTSISDKIKAAQDAVEDAIDKIKGFFDFEWNLPELKLPHIVISGEWDLKNGKFPSFGVEWYAKGAVLNQPTIFGMNGTNAMVGGEAGAEAVAPIDVLQGYVAQAVASQNAGLIDVLQKILLAIYSMDDGMKDKFVEALEQMRFDVNNREFARLVKSV